MMRLGLPVMAACFLTGHAMSQNQEALELGFGVYSYKRPTDVYRTFEPAIVRLQEGVSRQLDRKVTISIRLYKTYDECLQSFVKGEVDFVRFGPASYILALRQNAKVQLLVAEQEDGRKRCEGVIAVRADSPIKTLEDLRGRKFAFGDENSTIGRFLSQAELVKVGIRAKDLAEYRYLERHDKVFKVVEVGDFDAGAMHIATFEDLNKDGQLREVARFDNVGKPWIARAGLDPAIAAGLRRALLELKDPEALGALKVHGFLPTTDKDFDFVRKGMEKSLEFTPPPVKPPAPEPAPQPAPGKKG